MTTPIDTVRQALERVEAAQSAVPDLGIGAHDQESDVRYGKLSSLADTGRDLLEAMEKYGPYFLLFDERREPSCIECGDSALCLYMERQARDYARRVGEVVG